MATKFHCSMQKKKESLLKTNEDRSLGEVEYYEILKVTKNDAPVTNVTSTRYRSANELYKALDGICGATWTTKGNLVVAKEHTDSAIEGYLDLAYTDYDDTWVFRVWFTLKFTDPVATAIKDLGLEA